MPHPMSSPEPPSSEEVAAAAAPSSVPAPPDNGIARALKELQAGQRIQTELLRNLHETVSTSCSIIKGLVVANDELREEIRNIKGGGPSSEDGERPRKKYYGGTEFPAAKVVPRAGGLAAPGHTRDDEIDMILAERRIKGSWPVKHSVVNCFSVQQDLIKIRLHHSDKYRHIPVRIQKTEKNKDGTKPCKLCSEGKVRRKTTWMCSTCEVPLCTRPLLDEGGQRVPHHARWHNCQNLLEEHRACHAELTDGRNSRKRARVVVGGGGGEEVEESLDAAGGGDEVGTEIPV